MTKRKNPIAIVLDFETRSPVDLRKTGVYAYAEDPATEVLLAVLDIEGRRIAWVNQEDIDIAQARARVQRAGYELLETEELRDLLRSLAEDETKEPFFVAHNALFERTVWRLTKWLDYFPPFRWFDTMIYGTRIGLPASLEKMAEVLRVSFQKDAEGHRLMLRLCKPVSSDGLYDNDPEKLLRLLEYCFSDVLATKEIFRILRLTGITPEDQAAIEHTWKLNDRGVRIDLELYRRFRNAIEMEERILKTRFKNITGIPSPLQLVAFMEWVRDQGVSLPDLKAQTIRDALASKDIPGHVREAFLIRQALSKASTKKLKSIASHCSYDGRMRGLLAPYGAITGRWAGRGVQPHNLPRPSLPKEEIERISKLPLESLTGQYVIHDYVSSSLRHLFVPDPGHQLVIGDFSQIEARVLAALAGDDQTVKAFDSGEDVYLRAASSIYGIPPEKISKDQRFIGKVATLALGYQGGFRAFQKMAAEYGVEIPEDLAREIVMKWRQAHPEIVSLWKEVERAFRSVLAGGSPVSYWTPLAWIQLTIRFSFKILKNGEMAVIIELPSGRVLWYRHPRVVMDQTGRETLQYMSWNSVTRRYEPTGLYGGKLVENLVQAISRDFLWDALKRVDEHPETGLETLLHVHDEIVAQVPNSKAVQGVDALKNIMETLSDWTGGFRIAAEVKRASHYEK